MNNCKYCMTLCCVTVCDSCSIRIADDKRTSNIATALLVFVIGLCWLGMSGCGLRPPEESVEPNEYHALDENEIEAEVFILNDGSICVAVSKRFPNAGPGVACDWASNHQAAEFPRMSL